MRLTALLALAVIVLSGCDPVSGSAKKTPDVSTSVFDRIMETKTLRCGYIVYPPSLIKDVNTGAFSGISYDIITRLAKDLGLNVEWKEEVGPASMIEGLNTGRYDLMCTSVWTDSLRGTVALFTTPVYYTAMNVYARTGDNRFNGNLAAINSPSITIATLDGGLAARIASEDYPLAKTFSVPDLTDFSQLLLNVKVGKADVTFTEAAQAFEFERHNPRAMQNVTPDQPVRVLTNAFMIKQGENRLADMLNNDIRNLHNNGFIERAIAAHEKQPGSYRRVAPAFR